MRVAITGSSGLAKCIGDVIASTPTLGTINIVAHVRVEDVLPGFYNKNVSTSFEEFDWSQYDAFINCAPQGFAQCDLLMAGYLAWKDDNSKTIINISSRASQPNISKGYMYAAQKAALNHLSNNLNYNSEKQCRISTLNLGLLNHVDLPSISHNEVSSWIYRHLTGSKHIDIPEMTFQHSANYQDVQHSKEMFREAKVLQKILDIRSKR